MNNYNLTKMATQLFFPGNLAQLDDAGIPSILVYIPAFKNSDVLTGGDDSTHPAFIVNGKEIPGFYYSKYQNVVYNGMAYSLPAEDPQTNINFDAALAACEAKGNGWHMSTAAEWAAIALWCKKNGFKPYGNNDYGKDTHEERFKAVVTNYTSTGERGRVATGTGPLTWSHDTSLSGIWDMSGNGFEWQGGLRFVWGELQILANNNAADTDNPQNNTSAQWKAINAADGSLVDPECSTTDTTVKTTGSTIKVDYINNIWTYTTGITNMATTSRSCPFYTVTCDSSISDTAKSILRALALLPDKDSTSSEYEGDTVAFNNGADIRYVLRGGSWTSGTRSGLFALDGGYSGNAKYENLSFRAAYIPGIGQEG